MVPPGRNPSRHIRKYREKSRERFLTPEEFRRLRAAFRKFEAAGSMQPSAIAALRLLMLTGCRAGEILSLQWDDIDRTAGVLRLRDGKTGARTIHLSLSAVRVLEALPRKSGNPWVIPGNKPGRHMTDIDGAWEAIRTRAGLHDVRIPRYPAHL